MLTAQIKTNGWLAYLWQTNLLGTDPETDSTPAAKTFLGNDRACYNKVANGFRSADAPGDEVTEDQESTGIERARWTKS